jgi:cell division protein FtsW
MVKKRKTTKLALPSVSGDRPLLLSVFFLLGIGLLMVASSGVSYGNIRFGDEYYFLKRQLVGLSVGLFFLWLFQKISYQFWRKISVPLFFSAVVLLVLVLVPGFGTTAYGASRWLDLGPVSFQPSEIMKLALIVYFAAWLSGKNVARKTDFYEGAVPFAIVLSLIGFLILKQPDMGTLGVLSIIAFSIFFASGARLSHIGFLVGSGLFALLILIWLAPYRLRRMLVFLDPEHDPSGAGYQINQALIAIGSGGLFGLGLGHSRQKFSYLPEPMTDSIFAVLGEEFGLFGCALVIGLFVFFAYRGFHIARRAPDEFGRYLAVGIVAWVVFQAFMNIFAITGLMPLTGVPLPFLSYGGTSLAALLGAVGILLNISKRPKTE